MPAFPDRFGGEGMQNLAGWIYSIDTEQARAWVAAGVVWEQRPLPYLVRVAGVNPVGAPIDLFPRVSGGLFFFPLRLHDF